MDYSTLLNTVVDWIDNAQVTTTRASLGVEFVTTQLNRTLRVREMSTVIERALETGEYKIALPTGWLGSRAIRAYTGSRWVDLIYLTPEQFHPQIYTDQAASSPCYYTIDACHLIVTPEAAGSRVQMSYWSKIPALSQDNQSNWVLESHPDIYLFGALSHMETFVRNDDRVPVWEARYKAAIDALQRSDEHDTWSGGSLTMRAS